MKSMQRKLGMLAAILLLCSLALAAPPASAQGLAGISGMISDVHGKPASDIVVVVKSVDTGVTYNLKTDKNGVYKQIGLHAGDYDISIKNTEKDAPILTDRVTVRSDPDNKHDINLKERMANLSADQEAARKKQEETQNK